MKLWRVRLVYMLDQGGRTLLGCPVDARIKDMVKETFDWINCLMPLKSIKKVLREPRSESF